jgi:hypothetical protein
VRAEVQQRRLAPLVAAWVAGAATVGSKARHALNSVVGGLEGAEVATPVAHLRPDEKDTLAAKADEAREVASSC